MSDPEHAGGTEDSSQTRPKRSRAGCLTCRTRRRKCDEGKPICRNCVSKGFECRYAAAFQILGKNNVTPQVNSNVKYTKLKFVSGEGKEGNDENEVQDGHEPPVIDSPTIVSKSPARQKTTAKSTRSEEPMPSASSPSTDTYEYALHGLLALGSGSRMGGAIHSELNFSPPVVTGDDVSLTTVQHEMPQAQTAPVMEGFDARKSVGDQMVQDWRSNKVAIGEGLRELPPERVLDLLKCYRYDIAPWLDLCDVNQTFGCEVLHLSTKSTSVRYAILALAEKNLHQHTQYDLDLALLAKTSLQQDYTLDIVHAALLDTMSVVKEICIDVSRFWTEPYDETLGIGVLHTLLPEVGNGWLATSIYWLSVRLQLSVALMRSFTPRIPLPPPFTMGVARGVYSENNTDEGFRYAHDAVAMCVDAVMYCEGDEDRWLQQRYAQNRVEIWGTLVRSFEKWFTDRPQDFQAVIELYPKDGRAGEDEFPTLVFSGAGAIFANQLCHTGMLLLLQNKPRFSGQTSSNSPFMSTLWHTQRVCGIGINNDRRECWDPCLLASLLVAARLSTHQSQHIVILSALERVQKLTGWNFSHHLGSLRTEWQQSETW